MQIYIDDIIVKKTFYKHKNKTPELLRIYYLCNNIFSKRSGVFTIPELVDVMSDYGYKSLKHSSNRNKKIIQLNRFLSSAPDLFFKTDYDTYRTISKNKVNNSGRISKRIIDFDLLHKNNKREFYDLIIGIPADGRTIDFKTLESITGLTSARVCQAAKGNDKNGHIYKINNEISHESFKTKREALHVKFSKYGKNSICHIRKIKNDYHIMSYGANSYTSTVMLNPKSAKNQPLLNKLHESPVFDVIKNYGKINLCKFKSIETEMDYYWRNNNK